MTIIKNSNGKCRELHGLVVMVNNPQSTATTSPSYAYDQPNKHPATCNTSANTICHTCIIHYHNSTIPPLFLSSWIYWRNIKAYRFGFNGKENDGETGYQDYGFRLYDRKVARFISVDPLTSKYPMLTPYQFASNTPIQAIDLDGLEAFFIHGTTSSPSRWNDRTVRTLLKLTNNKTFVRRFSWEDLDGINNDQNDRNEAAKRLVEYIKANKVKGEEITLIGHSHGGNVAIQAAKLYYEETGNKVNLITIATPVYEDNDENSLEDPGTTLGQKAINQHLALWNSVDGVQGGLAGEETYKSSPKTTNYQIDVSTGYDSNETMDAHSFDSDKPELIDAPIQKGEIQRLQPIKQ